MASVVGIAFVDCSELAAYSVGTSQVFPSSDGVVQFARETGADPRDWRATPHCGEARFAEIVFPNTSPASVDGSVSKRGILEEQDEPVIYNQRIPGVNTARVWAFRPVAGTDDPVTAQWTNNLESLDVAARDYAPEGFALYYSSAPPRHELRKWIRATEGATEPAALWWTFGPSQGPENIDIDQGDPSWAWVSGDKDGDAWVMRLDDDETEWTVPEEPGQDFAYVDGIQCVGLGEAVGLVRDVLAANSWDEVSVFRFTVGAAAGVDITGGCTVDGASYREWAETTGDNIQIQSNVKIAVLGNLVAAQTNDGRVLLGELVYELPPPVIPAQLSQSGTPGGCVLGCPDTRVYVMDFCGKQTLCDVTDNVTFLKWGRELDDDSEVELTLHLKGDAVGAACCECLETARTWRNELMIVRGGEVVWGPGPLVTIRIQRHIAHLVARDITAWLDVRAVHTDYNFVGVDMSLVAQTIIEDALTMGAATQIPVQTRDACILDYAHFTPAGKTTDMEIKANTRMAGEVLRELAGQGLDFTVVNRSLHVGADFAFGPIGPLRDDDIGEDVAAAEHGLAAATKWFVSSDNAQGSCGGVDPFFGLIERAVEGQPASTLVVDLNREACDRLKSSNPPPMIVTVPSEGQLSSKAPICMDQLIPGTLVDLAIGALCRPATVRERLTSMRVTLDEKGERVGVTLAPLGELSLESEET